MIKEVKRFYRARTRNGASISFRADNKVLARDHAVLLCHQEGQQLKEVTFIGWTEPVSPDFGRFTQSCPNCCGAGVFGLNSDCRVCGGEGFGRAFDGDCPVCKGTGKVLVK